MEIQWHRTPQLTVHSCTTALCNKAPNRELGNDCLTAAHHRVAREEPETLGSALAPGTWSCPDQLFHHQVISKSLGFQDSLFAGIMLLPTTCLRLSQVQKHVSVL